MEVNPNPPNEGDTATERRGWGERARLSGLHPSRTVIRERPQSPLGILKAVCNRRAGRDGGIGRKRGHSQTGLARVCGDVRLAGGSVAEGCRQAGDGIACRRARARLTFSAQGQRSGRCRVNRRAERMSRRAREKNRRRRVLVVTSCSPRPMRAVQRARLCAITWTASQAALSAKRKGCGIGVPWAS